MIVPYHISEQKGSLDFSIFGTICMLADANKTLPLADTQDAS
jgi:hypothetical protein